MNKKLPIYMIAAIGAAALLIYLFPRDGDGPAEEVASAPDTEIVASDEAADSEALEDGVIENEAIEPKEIEPVTLAALDYENTFVMQLSTGGPVVIETYPDQAPKHVARFKELARQEFYDGIVFHRVIEGFMAQTGDPTGTGSGGSGQNIDAEFNDIPHVRGVVSTARAQHPDSADSQFFIMFDNSPSLDHQYTAWGKVVQGMEFIDSITRGPREDNGVVPEGERDSILSMRVLADVGEEALKASPEEGE